MDLPGASLAFDGAVSKHARLEELEVVLLEVIGAGLAGRRAPLALFLPWGEVHLGVCGDVRWTAEQRIERTRGFQF